MTRYEIRFLLLLLLLLGMRIAGFSHAYVFFCLGVWVLALSYCVGGYWLFHQQRTTPAIKIMAGVAFATAIISFAYTSNIASNAIYKWLPVVDGLFCVGLAVYMLLKRREAGFERPYGLWLRSVLLLGISAFFAYCPISFWPYRKALIVLNKGEAALVSNLLMFDYVEKYNAAMDREDYPAAVAYGQQALVMGKRWLGKDSVKARLKISGIYTNLYEAYEGLGDAKYSQSEYKQALQAFQSGHNFLVTGDHRENETALPNKYWEEKKAWSMNSMAFCYLKLRRFDEGDSLFVAAIDAYKKIYPATDVHAARLMGDVATSLTAQRQFDSANKVLLNIDRYLVKDTTRRAVTMRVENAMAISLNYIQQDSLPQALHALHAIAWAQGDTTQNRYKAGLQEAICLYKLERHNAVEKALQQPLAYYKRNARDWEAEAMCDVMLAKNSLALASYPKAQVYINSAWAMFLAQKQGAASSLKGICLGVRGALSKALGNYNMADQQLTQAVAVLRQDENVSSGTLSEALAQLADLDVTMGRELAAHEHVSSALALLLHGKLMALPSQTSVLAEAAYVDYVQGHYQEAGRKYRQVVAINTRYGQGQSSNAATAWNGLGLVEMAQYHYERADSIFQQAQRLYEKVFTERHPLTANVYLNYGLLRLKQHRSNEAALFFEKARSIAQAFLPADHDMFADLAVAMGDLAVQEKQAAVAHGYYEQALTIYTHKFPTSHWKVRAAKQKAGA